MKKRTILTVHNVIRVGFVTMYGMSFYKVVVKAIEPSSRGVVPVEVIYLTEKEATNLKAGDKFVF